MKSILQNVPLERADAQMGSLLLIAVDHILKCDRLHFFFCFLLDLIKKILKRQLNIDATLALFWKGHGVQSPWLAVSQTYGLIVRIYINPQQFFYLFCVDRQGEPKGSDFSVCRLAGFNLHTHFFHVSSRHFFATLPV